MVLSLVLAKTAREGDTSSSSPRPASAAAVAIPRPPRNLRRLRYNALGGTSALVKSDDPRISILKLCSLLAFPLFYGHFCILCCSPPGLQEICAIDLGHSGDDLY